MKVKIFALLSLAIALVFTTTVKANITSIDKNFFQKPFTHLAKSKDRALTKTELADINKAFEIMSKECNNNLCKQHINPVAHFFYDYYDNIKEVNVADLIRYMEADRTLDPAKAEDIDQFNLLSKIKGSYFYKVKNIKDMWTSVRVIKGARVRELFKYYTGLGLENFSSKKLGTYLKEYDAFYVCVSDFGVNSFTAGKGKKVGNKVVLIDGLKELTLEYKGGRYLIKSLKNTALKKKRIFTHSGKKPSVATSYIEINPKDKTFSFCYSLLSSYWPHGKYIAHSNVLQFNTDDGKYEFIFIIEDKNTLSFVSANPDNLIKGINKGKVGDKIYRGTKFVAK